MKKQILSLFMLLAFLVPAWADDVTLGYCDGGNVLGSVSGGGAVAIRLPADEFRMYAGTQITGVRIGLGTDAPKGVEIFVRESLSGDDILTFSSGPLYEGWSDIWFDSPVEYPAGDVCVGYEFPVGVKAGQSQVEGYGHTDCCWALDNGVWTDYYAKGALPLGIQLIVGGDSYSGNDVALLGADEHVVELGKPFTLSGLIRNNTGAILQSVRISYDYGDCVREADASVDDILPGEIGLFHLPCDAVNESGHLNCDLKIVSVAGKPDEYSFNNDLTVPLHVIGNIVPRKVLVEEFTGQGCPNCPSGKTKIEDALKDIDDVVLICHHIGYGEDSMTAKGSSSLLFFYNTPGQSYAPAVMFDRMQTSGNPGPVGNVVESREMRERILDRKRYGAQVTIGLDQVYDEKSGNLHIDASLRQIEGMELGSNPVLTLLLVEDGIVAFQNPAGDDYVHNEVVRYFVTSPLGDAVSLAVDESRTYSYDVVMNAGWKPENMRVVAFVSNHDTGNPNNCEVYNAEEVPVTDGSGVEGIIGDEPVISAIYDLSGQRIEKFRKGVNIVRYSDGSVRKVMF